METRLERLARQRRDLARAVLADASSSNDALSLAVLVLESDHPDPAVAAPEVVLIDGLGVIR